MFDKLRDLNNLRKQAAQIQKQLDNENFTETFGSVTLSMNGNQELLEVKILDGADLKSVEADFKNAYNKIQSTLKSTLAQKFQGMM